MLGVYAAQFDLRFAKFAGGARNMKWFRGLFCFRWVLIYKASGADAAAHELIY